jgi:hypothetical protein
MKRWSSTCFFSQKTTCYGEMTVNVWKMVERVLEKITNERDGPWSWGFIYGGFHLPRVDSPFHLCSERQHVSTGSSPRKSLVFNGDSPFYPPSKCSTLW